MFDTILKELEDIDAEIMNSLKGLDVKDIEKFTNAKVVAGCGGCLGTQMCKGH